MKLISHRGNINGPNNTLENNPEVILERIFEGYDVEIDVWYNDNRWFLGHDNPEYLVDSEFLLNENLWCHAKNFRALENMLAIGAHCFWHETDKFTLTSKGYIWTYPNNKLSSNSVCVLLEPKLAHNFNKNVFGICTDYVKDVEKILGASNEF